MAITCKVGINNITNIGDYVWCKYTAFANTIGTFSEFATKNDLDVGSNIIPASSSLTPNGYFRFIFSGYDSCGRKKLTADRNIQHSISWNMLNDIGMCSDLTFSNNNNMNPLIPIMTNNTTPSGRAFCSSYYGSTYDAWYAMNNVKYSTDTYYYSTTTSGYLGYELPSEKNVKYYRIDSVSSIPERSPKTWTFEGSNDGINWSILDTRTNQPAWTSVSETRYFTIQDENVGSYLMYRINVTATNGANLAIDVFQMYEESNLYDMKKYDITIKLPTGGIITSDKDNEWDKIIVESTLNNNITAGDNLIWNFNGITSWTSTSYSTSTNRIIRGGSSVANYSNLASSTVNATTGFRPILILDDSAKCYFFILDGNKYKSIVDGNLVTQVLTSDTDTVKEEAFLNYGMPNLNAWSNNLKSQLENNTFKICCYKL